MPTFDTLINEEQLMQIIAYIKSISPQTKPGDGTKQPAATTEPKPQKTQAGKGGGDAGRSND